jgi:hypothetical protein
LTNGLGRRVAEHLLCGAIPRGDDAVEGFAYDRIVGGIDDRAEQRDQSISAANLLLIREFFRPPHCSNRPDGLFAGFRLTSTIFRIRGEKFFLSNMRHYLKPETTKALIIFPVFGLSREVRFVAG